MQSGEKLSVTCEECQQEMPARAMGQQPDHPAALDAHLAECETCRQDWQDIQASLGCMTAWQVPDPRPDLVSDTWARIQSESRSLSLWQRIDRALQRFARHKPTAFTGLVTASLTVALLGHVLSPHLFRGRSSSDGTACERNLKLVARALETYRKEHKGRFPDRLQELRPDYLSDIPECPDHGRDSYSPGYQVSADHKSFKLWCNPNP